LLQIHGITKYRKLSKWKWTTDSLLARFG